MILYLLEAFILIFLPKRNGHKLTASTNIASSLLTTIIHSRCSCTFHAYIVIHFCDRMWFCFPQKRNSAGFLIACSYLHYRWDLGLWSPINPFNSSTCFAWSMTSHAFPGYYMNLVQWSFWMFSMVLFCSLSWCYTCVVFLFSLILCSTCVVLFF